MAMSLPTWVRTRPLTGSEPQIRWATTIRAKKSEELQKMTPRVIGLAIYPHIKEGDLESIHCVEKKKILSLIHSICIYALSCNEAKWWIEHRDEKVATWLPGAWRACLEHFQKTQPFK